MSNRSSQGGRQDSMDGLPMWFVPVDDDDDDDADFEDDDEPSVRRLERWSSRPGFGSPEWWSGS